MKQFTSHRHHPRLAAVICAAAYFLAGCAAAPEPQWVEVSLPDVSSRATLALHDATSSVLAAYPLTVDGATDVRLARMGAEGASSLHSVRVNDRPGDAAAHPQAPPQVAVGPDGEVYVAWIAQRPVPGRRFPASDIRFARSTDGGKTFSPATTVHPDPGYPTSHHFHHMTVGPDGTVYVSWLDGTARDAARQAMAASDAEHAHATMSHAAASHHEMHGDDDLPGTELRLTYSRDGGQTFAEPVVVAQGTCQCCRTAMATDSAGHLYLAWRHIFADGSRDMALATSSDGGRSFSPPVRVHADGWQIDGCPHAGPSLGVDDAGVVHVVWYSGEQSAPGVFYARSHDGGTSFGERTTLAARVPVAQVGAATEGPATFIVWEDPLNDTFHARVFGRASAVENLVSAPGRYPAVAAAGGVQAIAWSDGGRLIVRYRGI